MIPTAPEFVLYVGRREVRARLISDSRQEHSFIAWHGMVLLDENAVNKLVLEAVIKWYSRRHPITTETIELSVFTDIDLLRAGDWMEGLRAEGDLVQVNWVTNYFRDGRDSSESYNWTPNPRDRRFQENVVLKEPSGKWR